MNIEELKKDKKYSKVDFDHADLKLGQRGEITTFEKLKVLFPKIKKSKEFYSPFDYYSNDENGEIDLLVEVKTRRVNINTYPTLAFGKNKLSVGNGHRRKNKNIRILFCWLLENNELYFWEYFGSKSKLEYEFGYISNVKRHQNPSESVMVKTAFIKPFNYHNILSAK
jgi:hypothetical protein